MSFGTIMHIKARLGPEFTKVFVKRASNHVYMYVHSQ